MKNKKIAEQTLQLFIPLAQKLSMEYEVSELSRLVFDVLNKSHTHK